MKIRSGVQGIYIPLMTLIAIYSVSVVTSLPGLAIAPILGKLEAIFPHASDMKLQQLESLPSFMIIPFILLSGKLSVNRDKKRLLIAGLSIFFLSSLMYMFGKSLNFLLFTSVLLGVGAGMVIPLSTGLVADFFYGEERTKRLGVASAVNNLSLVVATTLAGYLAGINWRLAFLVYSLSLISLAASFKLTKPPKFPAKKAETAKAYKLSPHVNVKTDWPVSLMLLYFILTILALVIPFNLAMYLREFKLGTSSASGALIGVFFLSITIPGFFINYIIKSLGRNTNFYSLIAMTAGLVMFVITKHLWALTLGSMLVGLGYGIMQPIIYDKTANRVDPKRSTFALSLVMSMNYAAILLYPWIMELISRAFSSTNVIFPFIVITILSAIMTIYASFRRDSPALGIDRD